METIALNRLSDISQIPLAIGLNALLEITTRYGCEKLRCTIGCAYLHNGATDQLEREAEVGKSYAPTSLHVSQGIVGKAFIAQNIQMATSADLTTEDFAAGFSPDSQPRWVVVFPVSFFQVTLAVFRFDFEAKDQGSGEDKAPMDLMAQEMRAVEDFWKECQSPAIGKSLQRMRRQQIQRDLEVAGEAPSQLSLAVSQFITNLQQAFEQSNFEKPDLINVQIVDRLNRSIKTIQAVGMPLSFELSLSHTLNSSDIQADIVRKRQAEVIVGNDLNRFDQKIFNKYLHEKLVRLWMPLFPLRASQIIIEQNQRIENALEQILTWGPQREKEGHMKHRMLCWSKDTQPPESIIFGTLELGYFRSNENILTLDPWTKKRVFWSIARALELSADLHPSTLSGTLEDIGRLLAAPSHGMQFGITWGIPQRKIEETIRYPIDSDSLWGIAVPMEAKGALSPYESSIHPSQPIEKKIEPVTLEFEYTNPQESNNSKTLKHFEDHIKGLHRLYSYTVKHALTKAVKLFEERMSLQEPFNPNDDTVSMGMLVKDKEPLSVCQEATSFSGAVFSKLFTFEKREKPNSAEKSTEYWSVCPPLTWGNYPAEKKLSELEIEHAVEVASELRPRYLDKNSRPAYSEYPLCLLPMEFADGATAVLTLGFAPQHPFSEEEQRFLESRVPRWVNSLSQHRLVMRDRYSNLMMKLRREVAEARLKVETKSPKKSYTEAFLIRVLRESVKHFGQLAITMAITLHTKTATGPRRVERFWCFGEKNAHPFHTTNYLFPQAELTGPCRKVVNEQRVIINSDREHLEDIKQVTEVLESEAAKLERDGSKDIAEKLWLFSCYVEGTDEPSTMITIPVLERGKTESNRQGALTIILHGERYFDTEHRKLLTELGEILAENIAYVGSLDERRWEKDHLYHLQQRRKEFEKAEHADDVIGAFLRDLGEGEVPQQENRSFWGLAEDVVVWNLFHDNGELILRSARGRALDAIQELFEIVDCSEHPLLNQMEIAQQNNQGLNFVRLEGPFRLWTFPLEKPFKGSKSLPICNAYAEGTGRKWLTSFPIVDALGRIFGVIDLLREKPFSAEEEPVLERLLHRLSRQLCSTVESCNLKRARGIAKDLFATAANRLSSFRTQNIYLELTNLMCEEFRCKYCDLFLERKRYGRMVLHTTSRDDGPISEKNRNRFWVEPDIKNSEIIGTCLNRGWALIHHAECQPNSMTHLSPDLQRVMAEDISYERMALPLKAMTENNESITGILYLRGPLNIPRSPRRRKSGDCFLKKTSRFTAEDLRLARDIGLAFERIVQMLNLADQQAWLVDELSHYLAQPLQVLRSSVNKPIRVLSASNPSKRAEARDIKLEIDRYFDFVEEARTQVSILAKLIREEGKTFSFELFKLKNLVQECCDFMAEIARQGNNRISYSGVQSVLPVPIDVLYMRKALINLLENACKYSWNSREIRVRMSEKEGIIKIEITNWGIGIPKDDQKRIFEPYYRSRIPDARGTRPGTGIGLTIVKEAIESVHHGKVRLDILPYGYKNEEFQESREEVVNVEHETTFTIALDRNKLDTLKKQSDAKDDKTDG